MRRILVVDDEEKIRAIIRKYGEFEGYDITEAKDGMEAVKLCREQDFDVIILDIMMPELDGLSATRAIRGMDRPDARLPIIAMTANLFDEDVAACLAAGMDAHIPKPLEAGQMIRTIAEWLERKKQ